MSDLFLKWFELRFWVPVLHSLLVLVWPLPVRRPTAYPPCLFRKSVWQFRALLQTTIVMHLWNFHSHGEDVARWPLTYFGISLSFFNMMEKTSMELVQSLVAGPIPLKHTGLNPSPRPPWMDMWTLLAPPFSCQACRWLVDTSGTGHTRPDGSRTSKNTVANEEQQRCFVMDVI